MSPRSGEYCTSCAIVFPAIGVQFHLSLNECSWEYTYEPQGDATGLLEEVAPELASSVVFPDYMLSRFLVNLLKANYHKISPQTHNH
jgi:hypothetical protein